MKFSFAHGLPEPTGIAIVGVSGAALDSLAVERGVNVLQAQGFRVFNFYQHERLFQRFAATDAERLEQLNQALEHPEVQIVMGLRGSYGLSRLLPLIDYKKIAESNKKLIGYSDFNALQLAMLAKTQTKSFCGPMLCDDFTHEELSTFTQNHFIQCLASSQHQIEFTSDTAQDFSVRGQLWGGNLAILTHLVGTEYFPQIKDGILFVEDIAEHPYRVERMMLQLHFAGVLSQQKAIVFGNFSHYKLAAHDKGYDFDQMIAYLRSILSIPIVTGLPFGHVRDKACLVQGSEATLISSEQGIVLQMEY